MRTSKKKDLAIRFMQRWLKDTGLHVAYIFECETRHEALELFRETDSGKGNVAVTFSRFGQQHQMRYSSSLNRTQEVEVAGTILTPFTDLMFNIWLDEHGWVDKVTQSDKYASDVSESIQRELSLLNDKECKDGQADETFYSIACQAFDACSELWQSRIAEAVVHAYEG